MRADLKGYEQEHQCSAHGAYIARCDRGRMGWTTCPKCSEEQLAAMDRQRAQDDAERQLRRRDAWLHACRLTTGRYAEASLDTFQASTLDQRRALKSCREYAAQVPTPGGLFLIGPPGTGKTHLQAAICRAAIVRGGGSISARRVTPSDLVTEVRATWAKGSDDTEADVLRMYVRVTLLCLDDVGVGFGTEAEQKTLFDVVNQRYEQQRPTLVASNLTLEQIETAVGERVYDRLIEGAKVVVCNWPSHRRSAEAR
jgi:DNA replication protein DnaC